MREVDNPTIQPKNDNNIRPKTEQTRYPKIIYYHRNKTSSRIKDDGL